MRFVSRETIYAESISSYYIYNEENFYINKKGMFHVKHSFHKTFILLNIKHQCFQQT